MHRNEVVGVHDRVNESVEDDGEVDVTVVVDVEVEPVDQKNGRVVVDVEKAELFPLFANDNEEGVGEIKDFGDVEKPQNFGHCRIFQVELVAHEREVVSKRQHQRLDAHVRAEHDLHNVVEKAQTVNFHAVSRRQSTNHRTDDDKGQVDGDD